MKTFREFTPETHKGRGGRLTAAPSDPQLYFQHANSRYSMTIVHRISVLNAKMEDKTLNARIKS